MTKTQYQCIFFLSILNTHPKSKNPKMLKIIPTFNPGVKYLNSIL